MTDADQAPGLDLPTPVGERRAGSMTLAEFTGLVSLFNGELARVEGRITETIRQYAGSEKDRWDKHEKEVERLVREGEQKLGKLEGVVEGIAKRVDGHLEEKRLEEERTEARVEPVKNIARWIGDHWGTVILWALAIAGFLGFLGDRLSTFITPIWPH